MFRAYLGPSSGCTTVCIQQLVFIILFRWYHSGWMCTGVTSGFAAVKNPIQPGQQTDF